jgi:hypothetical protein
LHQQVETLTERLKVELKKLLAPKNPSQKDVA